MKLERGINSLIVSSIKSATKWATCPWLIGLESLIDSDTPIHQQQNLKIAPSGSDLQLQDLKNEGSTIPAKPLCKDAAVNPYSSVKEMLNTELCNFINSRGVRRLRLELVDLAERSSLHLGFLSPEYLSRLIFSLAFVFISMYLNAVASAIAGYRTPLTRMIALDGTALDQATLPDIGHDFWAWLLQRLEYEHAYIDFHSLPDQMLAFLGKITILFTILHPKRLMILRRVSVIVAILCILRATTVSVTTLPDASPTCQAQFTNKNGLYKSQNMFPKVFYRAWAFLIDPEEHITCGDMVFSGHTTLLVTCTMVFRKYFRAKKIRTKIIFRSFHIPNQLCKLWHWLISLYSFIAIAFIVGTRLHYTLDVIIAIFLTYFVFTSYHTWAKHDKLRNKIFILRWLEDDVVRKIDDQAYSMAARE